MGCELGADVLERALSQARRPRALALRCSVAAGHGGAALTRSEAASNAALRGS